MLRSYHLESTGSHQNSKVKLSWASLVLSWGITWEPEVTKCGTLLLSELCHQLVLEDVQQGGGGGDSHGQAHMCAACPCDGIMCPSQCA